MRKNLSFVYNHNLLEEALGELGYRVPNSSSKRVEGIGKDYHWVFSIQKTGTQVNCQDIGRHDFEKELHRIREKYKEKRDVAKEEMKKIRKEEKMFRRRL